MVNSKEDGLKEIKELGLFSNWFKFLGNRSWVIVTEKTDLPKEGGIYEMVAQIINREAIDSIVDRWEEHGQLCRNEPLSIKGITISIKKEIEIEFKEGKLATTRVFYPDGRSKPTS